MATEKYRCEFCSGDIDPAQPDQFLVVASYRGDGFGFKFLSSGKFFDSHEVLQTQVVCCLKHGLALLRNNNQPLSIHFLGLKTARSLAYDSNNIRICYDFRGQEQTDFWQSK